MPATFTKTKLQKILAQAATAVDMQAKLERTMLNYVEKRDVELAKVQKDKGLTDAALAEYFRENKQTFDEGPLKEEYEELVKDADEYYASGAGDAFSGHGTLMKSLVKVATAKRSPYVQNDQQRRMFTDLLRGKVVTKEEFVNTFDPSGKLGVSEMPELARLVDDNVVGKPGVIQFGAGLVPYNSKAKSTLGQFQRLIVDMEQMPLKSEPGFEEGGSPEDYLDTLRKVWREQHFNAMGEPLIEPSSDSDAGSDAASEAGSVAPDAPTVAPFTAGSEDSYDADSEATVEVQTEVPPKVSGTTITEEPVEFVEEAESRASPPSGGTITPQQVLSTLPENVEEVAVRKLSIVAMKARVRALHLVFDSIIPAFREKQHKKQKDDALKSSKKESVLQHLLAMLRMIREFHEQSVGQRVGVIIPAQALVKQLLSGLGVTDTMAAGDIPTRLSRSMPQELPEPRRIDGPPVLEGVETSESSVVTASQEEEDETPVTADPGPRRIDGPVELVPPKVPTERPAAERPAAEQPTAMLPRTEPVPDIVEKPGPAIETRPDRIRDVEEGAAAAPGMTRRLATADAPRIGRAIDHAGAKLQRKGDAFGHAIASSVYYRTSGLEAYQRRAVSGHILRTGEETQSASVLADPVQLPTGNHLQLRLRRQKKPLPNIKLN